MTFQVDAIQEYISLFIEITLSLGMCIWFLLMMSIIETFFIHYCLFNRSLLGHVS